MRPNQGSQAGREFLEKIRDSFGYLFGQEGFHVIKSAGGAARCLVVLESKDCRIRLTYEMGGIGLEIGNLEASPEWGGGQPPNIQWYGIYPVIDFIEGRPRPTLEESLARHEKLWAMSEDEQMGFYADTLKPVCDRVCQLFSKDAPAGTKAAFDSYISERFQQGSRA